MANLFSVEIARIQAEIQLNQGFIARDQALLASDPSNTRLQQQIASNQNWIRDLEAQLSLFQTEGSAPVASSGEIIAEAQQARNDDAVVQNPSQIITIFSPDGRITAQNIESGTNATTRTLIETQSTPPSSLTILNDDDGNRLPETPSLIPTLFAGVGAQSDDSGQPTKNSTRADIDSTFNQGKIIPQDNALDQYASYTYTASLYLMSPEGYKQLVQQKKKTIPGSQLLIQSGGAPIAGRNPYFGNDYYIDKIELRSTITGKGTNAAHNVSSVKLNIIEPNGITLITNLDKAVQAYLGSANKKKTNFTAPIYLLVIRFYGYDDSGNLVRGGVSNTENGLAGNAFIEKFYPITLSRIDFKVGNKAVEYEIEGAAVATQIAASSNRGTIPYNVEIGGLTVKDALTGPTTIVTTQSTESLRDTSSDADAQEGGFYGNPPPSAPNAGAAPNPKLTVRQGLMTALNQYQQDLVSRGIYTVADTYSIEFANASIEQARIQVKNPDKNKGSMPAPKTAADQKNPNKQSYDSTSRIISVTAGYQIVQFIDQVVRNSTYITDQALVKIGEQTGKQESNGKPGDNVAWYKITMQATPKKYDPKRNDYAYDIKYIVHAYRLNNLISNYFQVPKYNGVHKQYNYWFTGENTEVLSYEQTYNALYTAVLSGGPGQLGGSVVNDAIKANFQPASGENSQGAAGRVNEIGANAADYLYNPGDLANANLTIIGDPAWLQQGEAFAGFTKSNFNFNPFLPDGTINFESQQILFEILINTPSDYDLKTGIIDPNVRNTVFQNSKQQGANKQSYVYQATECISEFRQGKFTQQLKGTLLSYLPDQTFKEQIANGRVVNGSSTTSRLANISSTDIRGLNDAAAIQGVDAGDFTADDIDNSSGITEADLYAAEAAASADPQPQPDPEPPTSDGDITSIFEEQNDVQFAGVNIDSQFMDREA